MRRCRRALVLWVSRLTEVPVKIRDSWYGATYGVKDDL
jgi:hypothetical protein